MIRRRKRGGGLPPQFKKKKAPPFQGKVEGRNSVRRADRRAMQAGGAVSSKADGEPLSADTPDAPVGGAERQKFKAGGHITTAQRKALPSGDFALPGKGKGAGGKGPGSYPIDTPGRARNALARGAQHASSSELATIKRKVHAKYPGIGQE
jgi:hypothetical protein